jgi:hypothetical protein
MPLDLTENDDSPMDSIGIPKILYSDHEIAGYLKGPVAVNDLISSIYFLCLRIDVEQGLSIMAASKCDNMILSWYPPTSTAAWGLLIQG